MPWSVVCSHDLYWHWINWTLLCEKMGVSMLRLVWLKKKMSPPNRIKGYCDEQIWWKIVSWEWGRSHHDFATISCSWASCLQNLQNGWAKNGVQHATTIYPWNSVICMTRIYQEYTVLGIWVVCIYRYIGKVLPLHPQQGLSGKHLILSRNGRITHSEITRRCSRKSCSWRSSSSMAPHAGQCFRSILWLSFIHIGDAVSALGYGARQELCSGSGPASTWRPQLCIQRHFWCVAACTPLIFVMTCHTCRNTKQLRSNMAGGW